MSDALAATEHAHRQPPTTFLIAFIVLVCFLFVAGIAILVFEHDSADHGSPPTADVHSE